VHRRGERRRSGRPHRLWRRPTQFRGRHSIKLALWLALGMNTMAANNSTLTLNTRFRKETPPGHFQEAREVRRWAPHQTAIIICDMWDRHWCEGATRRVAEMAPVMNEVVRAARQKGVFIIHAPSETMPFYEDTPQRRRAQEAPMVEPPTTLKFADREEPPLPIDDSDGGCDSGEKPWHQAWTRQHPALEIAPQDAISDKGNEVYNLLQQRGIDNVILMGVHTNMCVLGRPFAIRRMVALGKNVLLMRDMTDTMYNPGMPPHVSHFRGTELVIEHIEKYWCPSVTSTDFTGKPPFRFKDDHR
jgi:nicotinamidase-related amidase